MGCFGKMICIKVVHFFWMEEKLTLKEMNKVKGNYQIPSHRNRGVSEVNIRRVNSLSAWEGWSGCMGGSAGVHIASWTAGAGRRDLSLEGTAAEAELPFAGFGLTVLCKLQRWGGTAWEEEKPCAMTSCLIWCKMQDKLQHFHFLYINIWFSQGTALH